MNFRALLQPMANDPSYQAAFERLWAEHFAEAVPNGKPDHASALLQVFFSHAKRRVALFWKNLPEEIFGDDDLLCAVKNAIGREIQIDVLVQERVPETSAFANLLKSGVCHNKVTFCDDLKEPFRSLAINFAFADDHACRVAIDREKNEAVASAWNKKVVSDLTGLFDHLKASCLDDASLAVGPSR